MNVIIVPFLVILRVVLDIAYFAVIAYAVIETLFAFEVFSYRHRRMCMARSWLKSLLEPILHPIRLRLPQFGAIDIATLVFLLAIIFCHTMITEVLKSIMISTL